MKLQQQQKKPLVLNSGTLFSIVLVLAWTRGTVVSFALQFLKSVPYFGALLASLYPAFFTVLVVFAIPWMQKRVRMTEIIIYFIAAMVVVMTFLTFPQNAEYLNENLSQILVSTLLMVFVGVCYDHERHKDLLFWASLFGMLVMVAYQNYQLRRGVELMADNMDAAYKVMPHVLYLLYYACVAKQRQTLCWGVALFGGLSLFIFGTRGPILCMFVFLSVCLLLRVKTMKSTPAKLLSVIVIGMMLWWVFSGDAMIAAARSLSRVFDRIGFSTRVFDYFIEGEVLDGSGRERLIPRAFAAIRESPLLGYGLMGDRVQMGRYPHNMFVELWFQFGVFFGTLIALAVVVLMYRALRKYKKTSEKFLFIFVLICMSFVKLMLSSSYIVEPYLFFMLGACLTALRDNESSVAMSRDHLLSKGAE